MIPLQRYFVLSLTLLLSVPLATFGQATYYTPSSGGGTTLNIAAGKALCGSGPSPATYAGGTLSLSSGNGVYNVYLDPASSCAPAFTYHAAATPFTIGHIPIAQVTVSGGSISNVADVRSWFQPNPCAADSSGTVNCAAPGTNQKLTLALGGSGAVTVSGPTGQALQVTASGPTVVSPPPIAKLTNNRSFSASGAQNILEISTIDQGPSANPGSFHAIQVDTLYGYYGADLYSYGLYIAGGQKNYLAGNLGVGTTSPVLGLQLYQKAMAGGISASAGSGMSETWSINTSTGNIQQFACGTGGAGVTVTLANPSSLVEGEVVTLIFVQNSSSACTISYGTPQHIWGGMTSAQVSTLGSANVQQFVVSNNGTDLYAAGPVQSSTGGTP